MNQEKKLFKKAVLMSIIGLFLIGSGARMVVYNVIWVGIDLETHQPTSIGGYLLIIIGIIILIVSYYTLSPYGAVRSFFEDTKGVKRG